jgi:enoyl-[acyl-carrier protein] reductase III
MKRPFDLVGKQIVVTGGTRGIGRAISLQLARAGASVMANYVRDIQSAESLLNEAKSEGLSIVGVRADLGNVKGIDALVTEVEKAFPALSGLVHCAATGVHRPFEQLTLRHFDWTFGLNLRAIFDLTQKLLPLFKEGGSIVGMSSEGAVRAIPQYALVGATKGGLEALLRHLAVELAPRGIRVNILAPGTILTDAWRVLPDSEHRLAEAARRSALGRLCTLEEVAHAAQFLCSDAASGIVGQTLVVDGGSGIAG